MKRRSPGKVVRQMPRIYGNLQKERKDWRPLLRGFVRTFWVVVGVGFLYVVFFGPLFHVKTVDVQGVTLSNPDFIRQAVPLGGSIWRVPTTTITKQIIGHEPVDSLEILRGLPSTVRIVVHEHEPIIAWVAKGQVSLLDSGGSAFLQYPMDSVPGTDTAIGKKIASLPRIIDNQNIQVQLGAQVVGSDMVQFTDDTMKNMHLYLPALVVDHIEVDTSLYDITILSKSGMRIMMNVLADSGIEVRNLTRLIQQGKTKDNSTVDLRIDRWAYVHE